MAASSQKGDIFCCVLFHDRKIQFAKHAVHTWYEELKKSKPRKQLTLLYLANDVLQNGRRKGNVPEYISYFRTTLPKVLHIIGKDQEIRSKAVRVVNIWEQREIYPKDICLNFKKHLSRESSSESSSVTILYHSFFIVTSSSISFL